jgi:hypothetical protein
MTNFNQDDEQIEDTESPWFRQFQHFHHNSMENIEAIREKLRQNDQRLRSLESQNSETPKKSWTSTVEDADLLIATVATIELIHNANEATYQIPDQLEDVTARFPGLTQEDLAAFANASPSSQMGTINHLQGFLGEQISLDLINSGSIPVPEGYTAQFAESTNTPAYDFRMMNDQGSELFAQVKIGADESIIRNHLIRYPDVNIIYTNTEVAKQLAQDHSMTVIHHGDAFPDPSHAHAVIVDIGITQEQIRNNVSDFVTHSAAEHSGHFNDFWRELPLISIALIVAKAARDYTFTDDPEREILSKAGRRVRDIFTAIGLGQGVDLLVNTDVSGIVTPTYVLTINAIRVARGNFEKSSDLAKASRIYLSGLGTPTTTLA